MPQSVVTLVGQVVDINDVLDIKVTETVPDGDGAFVRSIRIFGSPESTNQVAVLEVRVRSQIKENIDVTTPQLNF
jgi:hypothetical protein